jgi:hypothetical protein
VHETSPDVVAVAIALREAIPYLLEVVRGGYGYVTIHVAKGKLSRIEWHQSVMF